MMKLRRLAVMATIVGVTLLLATLAVALLAWKAVAAREGEWSLPLRFTIAGHVVEQEASVAVLLRLASHPLAARVVDGRTLATSHGRWTLHAPAQGSLQADCAPCSVTWAALGPAPLKLERAQLTLFADGADRYHGTLALGPAPRALTLHWRGAFDKAGHFTLDARLPTSPLSHAVHVLGADLPERDRVEVKGTLALTLAARLPGGAWQLRPVLEGFEVHGLGTERLLDMQRPAACRIDARPDVPTLGGWLPRAVIAAEDQRFFEHPGYDLAALTDALAANQRADAPLVGASTLTQQLAKLTVTGGERSATRKLRELLYAVEMERTLGKARILQLYLALAPWGDGVCGAERAVRVHLGQRDTSAVGPVASAWLASLLSAPDAHLHADMRQGRIDEARVRRVLEAIRPMRAERREKALDTLPFWSPPVLAPARQAVPPDGTVAGSPSP